MAIDLLRSYSHRREQHPVRRLTSCPAMPHPVKDSREKVPVADPRVRVLRAACGTLTLAYASPHPASRERESDVLIVDAQVHIWGADTPERPWPPAGRPTRIATAAGQGRSAARDGRGRRRSRGDRAAVVGGRSQRPRAASLPARIPIGSPSWAGCRCTPPIPAARGTWRPQPGMLGLRFTVRARAAPG